jgi:hypothetical protein
MERLSPVPVLQSVIQLPQAGSLSLSDGLPVLTPECSLLQCRFVGHFSNFEFRNLVSTLIGRKLGPRIAGTFLDLNR